jgi:hypothetical protein
MVRTTPATIASIAMGFLLLGAPCRLFAQNVDRSKDAGMSGIVEITVSNMDDLCPVERCAFLRIGASATQAVLGQNNIEMRWKLDVEPKQPGALHPHSAPRQKSAKPGTPSSDGHTTKPHMLRDQSWETEFLV